MVNAYSTYLNTFTLLYLYKTRLSIQLNFSLACSAMIAQFTYFAVWLSSIK